MIRRGRRRGVETAARRVVEAARARSGGLLTAVRDHDWIADAWLRLREEGHVFVGELLVVPVPGTDRLVERLEDLGAWVRDLDWRIHDLVVAPVTRIEGSADDHDRQDADRRRPRPRTEDPSAGRESTDVRTG